jgi:hypothetical protein
MSVHPPTSTLHPQITARIQKHIDLIPFARRQRPTHREVTTEEDALNRLNNWAFCEGYGYVARSSHKGKDITAHCVKYQKETRNTRKLTEDERKQSRTNISGTQCPHKAYISAQKKLGGLWVFSSFTNEHNHPPAVDPFDLSPHYNSDIDREKAKEITMAHRGTTTYT